MNLRYVFGVVAGLAVGGLGFAAEAVDEPQGPDDPLIQAVADSSTRFAAGLYSQLKAQPGNLAFAPFGLSQALMPLAAGARGTTEAELAKVLHLSVPAVDAADGYAVLSRRLQRAAGGEGALSFAKALWVQQWNSVNSDFVDLMREHCRSELRVIDFTRGKFAAHWMNKWIAERTDDLIPAIADSQTFDESTRLVVGNAVYFKAGWKSEFDPAQTAVRPFFAAAEPAPVDVPTMRQTAPYRLSTQPGFRLLQMPYRGDRLVMVVLLPELGDNLPRIEAELTADRIAECLRSVHEAAPARVELSLPRFKADRPVAQLTTALREMGAHQIFDRNGAADLSGLGTNFDGEPIYLSGVSHLAKFVVDEQGAQAVTAQTTVAVAGTAEPPVPAPVAFHVDHPFLFFICDPTTGSLLFMGRVVDPRVS